MTNNSDRDFASRKEGLSVEKQELLAKRLQGRAATTDTIQPRPDAGPELLSFSQAGLYFLEQFSPGLPEYNVPLVFRLSGSINVDAISVAFDYLVLRHEVLRTRFVPTNGIPRQEVLRPRTRTLRIEDVPADAGADTFAACMRRVEKLAEQRFDFAKGYLFDAVLYRLGRNESVLCAVFHHIVFDGWSTGIFCREISELYNARLESRESDLPPLRIQFSDFAHWQRAMLSSGTNELSTDYWMSSLAGPLPELKFLRSTDSFPKSPSVARWTSLRLPEMTMAKLRECHGALNTTVFTVMLAAWKVLLFRYSGESDILVGSVFAGRQNATLDHLIGYFTNTLPLRTAITNRQTFRDTVAQVRTAAINAQEHQDVPFELLVDKLKPSRVPGRVPIIENVFVMQNASSSNLQLNGIASSRLEFHNSTTKFPLSLMTSEESDRGLRLELEYSLDVLDDFMAARMLEHYLNILDAGMTHLDMPLVDLPMLDGAEVERLLNTWNATNRAYPSESSIVEVFELQVQKTSHLEAVTYDQTTLTYGELNARANQFARALQYQGVTTSSLVAIAMRRSTNFIVSILGTLKLGCAYLPLDPDNPRIRNLGIVEDARPDFILCDDGEEFLMALKDRRFSAATWNDLELRLEAHSTENISREVPNSNALAYVIYTSGSTGSPKGVEVTHRGVLRLVLNTNYVEISESCRVAQVSNMAFDASTFEIWGALLNGGCLIGVSRGVLLSPKNLKMFLEESRIDTVLLTTGLFNHIVSREPDAFASVRNLLCGGEALSTKWVRRMFESRPPSRFLNCYGPTECTTIATAHEVSDTPGSNEVIPIGLPIANTKAYVIGRHGCLLPTGLPGELCLGGDGVAIGYRNNPKETADRFTPNPFCAGSNMYRSGDIVRRRHDGALEYLGRFDSQEKIRGFRIELGEIEVTIRRYPAVKDAAVIVAGGEDAEKHLICYFVSAEGTLLESSLLRQYLRERLPDYMVPSRFFRVVDLPLNANGKVDRSKLPQLTDNAEQPLGMGPEFGSEFERQLVRVWSRIVGHDEIGRTDSFFDAGGNSLLTVQLVSHIEDAFNVRLTVRDIFENPTIATQARVIETLSLGLGEFESHDYPSRTDCSLLLPVRSEGSFTPLFFVTGAGDVVGTYTTLVDLLSVEQPFYGFPDPLFSSMTASDFDVSRLAERYESEIRRVQQTGPYYLGGYSFGAIIAFEMARRLMAQGERIAMLIIMDTGPHLRSSSTFFRALRVSCARVRYAFNRMGIFVRWRRILFKDAAHLLNIMIARAMRGTDSNDDQPTAKEYILWSLRNVANLNRQGQVVEQVLHSREARLEMLKQPHIRRLNQSMSHALRATKKYRFEPYPGRITLFRATDDPTRQNLKDESLGWRSLARGGVEIIPVPGTHNTLFIQPNVKTLAAALQSCLDAARAQFGMNASDQGVSQEELQPTEDQ